MIMIEIQYSDTALLLLHTYCIETMAPRAPLTYLSDALLPAMFNLLYSSTTVSKELLQSK